MVWNWEERDHPWHTEFLPAAYGLFLMVWSAAFLQGWKREDSALGIRWGVENESQSLDAKVRVQYYGIPRDSPVRVDLHGTAAQEVWYPTWMRVIKYMLTSTIVAVSLVFVASSLAALVLFRAWFEGILGLTRPTLLTVIAGGCVSGPVVLLLNGMNTWLARKLVRTHQVAKQQPQWPESSVCFWTGRVLCGMFVWRDLGLACGACRRNLRTTARLASTRTTSLASGSSSRYAEHTLGPVVNPHRTQSEPAPADRPTIPCVCVYLVHDAPFFVSFATAT